ncbi:alpha-hydroxy-acid oxidizing protein [Pseudobacillus wudalianchiensis]|uniref:L-lactate oxidase n=1 Tax=Pseudobacillus wudalianchiensis TaxID=1743143 RepID=A0A1B9B7W3_9BACI|nr:alpha-hydroxy-acid oxidizing protein [Bacillus wudalianchiensis]OCA92159.1 alpha-hydroxy-acid oxidizing enzyme [Bacillus wudalianchiensis]
MNQQEGLLSVETDRKEIHFPLSFEEWEQKAAGMMQPGGYGYACSGAGKGETGRRNEEAFGKWAIVPRMLSDVSDGDMSVTLFGRTYKTPFLLAPIGMQKLAHPEGELASVKAASNLNVPFILSTVASHSIEEVAAAAPTGSKWFQLYWSNNEEISFSMVERAEKAGYEAIVVTVDTVRTGFRETDIRSEFSPLSKGLGKANYVSDPAFMKALKSQDDDAIVASILENIQTLSLHWRHIAKLKERTNLPILLKGILHPEDVQTALEYGVDGIIVSNHGGRQLDGVIGALDALPSIAEAVQKRIPVLFDSGIRRGTDVVKALALGADAVLIGRPFLYGLAAHGQQGVEKVIEGFTRETEISLSLSGIANLSQIGRLKMVRA